MSLDIQEQSIKTLLAVMRLEKVCWHKISTAAWEESICNTACYTVLKCYKITFRLQSSQCIQVMTVKCTLKTEAHEPSIKTRPDLAQCVSAVLNFIDLNVFRSTSFSLELKSVNITTQQTFTNKVTNAEQTESSISVREHRSDLRWTC